MKELGLGVEVGLIRGRGMAILLVLSIMLISLTVLDRLISIKMNEKWNKLRLFNGIMIIFLIFLISYFGTDTATGIFCVSATMIMNFVISLIISRINIERLKYSANIIGIPILILLLMKATENMLMGMWHLSFLMIISKSIISYPDKEKGTVKEYVSLAIGIVISLGLIYSYSNYLPGDRIMSKQKMVAQEYLEEELGLEGLEVYAPDIGLSIRGEEQVVRAYDPAGRTIKMIYKNNEIIDWTEDLHSDEIN